MVNNKALTNITSDPEYALALQVLDEMRSVGFGASFKVQGEDEKVNMATFELYQRVKNGENAMEIAREIKDKYNVTVQNLEIPPWSTYWVGTEESPDEAETVKKIEASDNTQLAKEKEINKFRAYMNDLRLRQGRK